MRDWTAQPDSNPALDQHFMDLALSLGRTNLGQTWPNPSVGAVVVKNGIVVGQGATGTGGRPHAEAIAIGQAGLDAVGATLYVTLEPCSHRSLRGGKPCLEHTILSGIRRVVSALKDPNPHISGVSHALLRSSGVKVTVGVGAEQARRDHLGHILRVQQGRPLVTLKLAQTADGYCAPAGGGRMQISGDMAMREVHQLRACHETIMVGVGTVLSDDPQLNVRLPGLEERSPIRVILDSQLRIPLSSKLVQDAPLKPLWIITAEDAPVSAEHALELTGAKVMRVGRGNDGMLDLAEALQALSLRGVTRIFSEGGPIVGEALAKSSLADVIIISTADHSLNADGVIALRPGLAKALEDPMQYQSVETRRLDTDVFKIYEKVI